MVRELVALVIQREVSQARWRRKEPVELHCRRCGRPVLWAGIGRRRKWCSPGCKKAVQRRRDRERPAREAEAASWLELQGQTSAARSAHQAPPAGGADDWASWPYGGPGRSERGGIVVGSAGQTVGQTKPARARRDEQTRPPSGGVLTARIRP